MCELFIMGYDKTHTDPKIDPLCPKKGIVITAQDDGWKWSKAELGSAYKILKLPGVAKNDPKVVALMQPDGTDLDDIDKAVITHRRKTAIDLDSWSKTDDDYLKTASTADMLTRLESKQKDISTAADLGG